MTARDPVQTLDLSRRSLLSRATLIAAGGAMFAAGAATAQTKVAHKVVNYQETPKGKARCDSCTQWQAPSSCKTVASPISPSAWCSLYAPKA